MRAATTDTTTPAAAPDADAGLGLRERKKRRTRQAIRAAARRLIDERGYDNTTIEQIAAAADVSPSTVFRYFPSKEYMVLREEEYAGSGVAFLRERPADEPPLLALRQALTQMARTLGEEFHTEYQWRIELARKVPAVRAQMQDSQDKSVAALTAALAERAGRPADDFDLRVLVGAVMGGLHQVVLHWGEHGREGDLARLMDRALAVLGRDLAAPDHS
ncbi:TetR/AcrR family transcriptional regulator [Streptomyces broussonetiae]|uniref:TetR family transcriptional regulator n=1 Tax=Streptomyces broussonetiae TaxID=2686304 RepID=A0ABV5EJD1_9ACTN